MRKELAKIKDTFFGIEDHGILSFNIDFDFGGSGQGTGHYNIQGPSGWMLLKNVMETLGVREWKHIGGQNVYVIYNEDNYNARVSGFETLPFDGPVKRIIFKEFVDGLSKKEDENNV